MAKKGGVNHTANEGPVRIQYKCLVPISVLTKWNCYFQNRIIMFYLPVSSPICISVRGLYISRIGLPILLQGSTYVDRSCEYIKIAHRHMNMEIGTEAAQFPEKEYINGIFLAVYCSCVHRWHNLGGVFHWLAGGKKLGSIRHWLKWQGLGRGSA
jgi:hypothetical protein